MKKQLFTLALFIFSLSAAFAQSAEEAAIKKTIEDEKTAGDNADYKAYLSHWVKAPYSSFIYNGIFLTGDELFKAMDARSKQATAHKTTNVRSDWNFRIVGNAAFVTFSQKTETPETQSSSETAEARFMEKVNGVWKIVNVTAVSKTRN